MAPARAACSIERGARGGAGTREAVRYSVITFIFSAAASPRSRARSRAAEPRVAPSGARLGAPGPAPPCSRCGRRGCLLECGWRPGSHKSPRPAPPRRWPALPLPLSQSCLAQGPNLLKIEERVAGAQGRKGSRGSVKNAGYAGSSQKYRESNKTAACAFGREKGALQSAATVRG